ncbi:MAG: hypothetical protein RQ752_02465 [Thermohalobaculum sp.]|nr:hypothetical protein [Thermohalobaculum sp.]
MTDAGRRGARARHAARICALAIGLAIGLAAPEPRAEGSDAAPGTALIFATDQLAGLAPGGGLAYSLSRNVAAGSGARAIGSGAVGVTLTDTEAVVRLTEDGRTRQLDPFPRAAGNPVFLVFLESALGALADQSGGSPFYLRNRIKEAFWRGAPPEPVTASFDGAEIAAERVVFRPFAADPHRAELGDLAGLELEFVLAPGAPGRFLSLIATTPPGAAVPFREEIRLIGETPQ